MSSVRLRDAGDMQVVAVAPAKPNQRFGLLLLPVVTAKSTAIVEYTPLIQIEVEDLEVKLRRIPEHVPVNFSNTSGSSAWSGSGDFHQAFMPWMRSVHCCSSQSV